MVPSESFDKGFLFAFHSNYRRILYRFRDIAIYLPKIAIISKPLAFEDPLEASRRNIAIPFGVEKLEWCGRICLAV